MPRDDKIAAIGVKLRHWVSFHGISLNVAPDLGHYAGIVPCGISDHGVTSLEDMGIQHAMDTVDAALEASFRRTFGATVRRDPPTLP
jgi:lipoyl(octanoyl) transferase